MSGRSGATSRCRRWRWRGGTDDGEVAGRLRRGDLRRRRRAAVRVRAGGDEGREGIDPDAGGSGEGVGRVGGLGLRGGDKEREEGPAGPA